MNGKITLPFASALKCCSLRKAWLLAQQVSPSFCRCFRFLFPFPLLQLSYCINVGELTKLKLKSGQHQLATGHSMVAGQAEEQSDSWQMASATRATAFQLQKVPEATNKSFANELDSRRKRHRRGKEHVQRQRQSTSGARSREAGSKLRKTSK